MRVYCYLMLIRWYRTPKVWREVYALAGLYSVCQVAWILALPVVLT